MSALSEHFSSGDEKPAGTARLAPYSVAWAADARSMTRWMCLARASNCWAMN